MALLRPNAYLYLLFIDLANFHTRKLDDSTQACHRHKFSWCKNGVCLDVECWLMALLHSRFWIVLDSDTIG